MATSRPVSYLPLIRREWRFLGFGFVLLLASSVGQTYFVSVFGGEIRATFDISDGTFGLFYMLATLGSAALLLHLGPQIDVRDLRRWTAAVTVGAVAACLLMGLATTPWLLLLGLFAVRFTGQGLLGHTALTSMARYYETERGRALSIAGLGFSVGNALFPPLGVWLIAHLTWNEAWRWVAVGLAATLLPLTAWLLRGHAERHRVLLEQSEARRARRRMPRPEGETASGARDDAPAWTRAQVLRDRRFHLLLPGLLAPPFILTGFIFHQVRLAEAKGWDLAMLASAFLGFAVSQSLCSLVLGPHVDRLGARRLARVFLVPLGLAMLVLALLQHPVAGWLYLLLAGATAGAAGPVVGSLWAELYGVLHLGAIRSLGTSLMVLATALAPFVFGWLIDRGVSIEVLAWASAGYVAAATGAISLALRREPSPGG